MVHACLQPDCNETANQLLFVNTAEIWGLFNQVALEGVGSADLEAISRTAKHRLDRGIWTSTGAGKALTSQHLK